MLFERNVIRQHTERCKRENFPIAPGPSARRSTAEADTLETESRAHTTRAYSILVGSHGYTGVPPFTKRSVGYARCPSFHQPELMHHSTHTLDFHTRLFRNQGTQCSVPYSPVPMGCVWRNVCSIVRCVLLLRYHNFSVYVSY